MFLEDINIRDPFIVPVREDGRYYLFGTTDETCWGGPATGFDAYYSKDLKHWEGPVPVFRPPVDFWATTQFWAPEVHAYHGRYYMFASFKADNVCRGTQILVSDAILGPYVPHSDGPVTPREWECLDGTLYVDDEGKCWLVFCHEWLQVHNGEICAMPLSGDLKTAAGSPTLLFRADEAPWVHKSPGAIDFVTDGPFLYRAGNGELLMLWSSGGSQGYAMGIARSAGGNVLGPWVQDVKPFFGKDGGHGMLFRTFEGKLMATIHQPNEPKKERPILIPVTQTDGVLRGGSE
jgi:arabinan endo-1,5-alpha-L-arabinosidase